MLRRRSITLDPCGPQRPPPRQCPRPAGSLSLTRQRLVFYCRTTSVSTAPCKPRRTYCPYAYVLITVHPAAAAATPAFPATAPPTHCARVGISGVTCCLQGPHLLLHPLLDFEEGRRMLRVVIPTPSCICRHVAPPCRMILVGATDPHCTHGPRFLDSKGFRMPDLMGAFVVVMII